MRFIFVVLFALGVAVPAWAGDTATAVFAGGNFWSIQIPFDAAPGVVDSRVGFTGGKIVDPTYMQVATGNTGHMEAVEVTYDPSKITFEQLLNVFWHNIDPVDADGQFCDKGPRYRTAIFYANATEQQKADDSKMLMEADDERFNDKPIATQILPRTPFYPAEDAHQRYYKKNPLRYEFYRGRCGVDPRLQEIWGHSAPQEPTH